MLIERELERRLVEAFSEGLEDAEVVGSRQPSDVGTVKGERDVAARSVVAVSVGFRTHDAFSLTPISVSATVAVTTRAEMDATGECHEAVLEKIADRLSLWHKDADMMTDALSFDRFFAGELRMDGGSGRQYDPNRSTWVETVTFTIRGAERFS